MWNVSLSKIILISMISAITFAGCKPELIADKGKNSVKNSLSTGPQVAAISPDPLDKAIKEGTEVTLVGTGFTSGMTVKINGVNCTDVKIESSEKATCSAEDKIPKGEAVVEITVPEATPTPSASTSTSTIGVTPSDASININSSAAATGTTAVTLTLYASNATGMYITNTIGCASGGSWESYGTSKAWILGSTDTSTKVYVKYRSSDMIESECVSDSITHDATGPVAVSSVTLASSWHNSLTQSPVITWTAATDTSGISKYEYSIGTTAGATGVLTWTTAGTLTTATASGLTLTGGQSYFVNVRATDSVGNVSSETSSSAWIADATLSPAVTVSSPTASQPIIASSFLYSGFCEYGSTLAISYTGAGVSFTAGSPTTATCGSCTVSENADCGTGYNKTGKFSFRPVFAGASGNRTLSIVQTDRAGNVAAAVSRTIAWTSPASFCGAGDLDTTCEISTTQTLANGAVLSGDGALDIKPGGVITASGTDEFSIKMTGDVTLRGHAITAAGKITGNLTVLEAANLTIESNTNSASVNVDAKGNTAQTGSSPGTEAGLRGSGGAHGGFGGSGEGNYPVGPTTSYGSVTQPASLGSGGGNACCGIPGGTGGGKAKFVITGTMTVDGTISANGSDGTSNGGGGAGGSVWISTGVFAGAGAVRANGGNGANAGLDGGGGGGGRVAIYYTSSTHSGTVTAYGGTNSGGVSYYGGAGSVYIKPSGTGGDLKFINTLATGGATDFDLSTTDMAIANFIVNNQRIKLNNAQAATLTIGTLDLQANASIISSLSELSVTTLNMAATSSINANGLGSTSDTGTSPGTNASLRGSGGAHGGFGGAGQGGLPAGPATSYGSVTQPVTLGSGGGQGCCGVQGGGAGGGRIKLIVSGTLTQDGTISANGATATDSGGGGAGGSIWINAGTWAGAGAVTANGGVGTDAGTDGGGGGGGRIAIYYTNSSHSGAVTAYGGSNAGGTGYYGGAGSIYIKPAATNGDLKFINIVSTGAATDFDLSTPSMTLVNFILNNQSIKLTNTQATVIQTLDLQAGSSIINSLAELSVTTLNIAATASISANGLGSGSDAGTSPGINASLRGSGGAHGGAGGGGTSNWPAGPTTVYGSMTEPAALGSGGGQGCCGVYGGGAGGGKIKLIVSGTLTQDGAISSNGATGTSAGGGGSGGSIWVSANTWAGAATGTVTANGGNGDGAGGGGAGGRIAIYYTTKTYAGTVVAYGGGSSGTGIVGGPGTSYQKASANTYGSLKFDNNGQATTAAIGYLDTSAMSAFHDLDISGNANVKLSTAVSDLSVAGNLNIGATSVLHADYLGGAAGAVGTDGTNGVGTTTGKGINGSTWSNRGGGGGAHAGNGGAGQNGGGAGGTGGYGNANGPVTTGSGGGGSHGAGGAGGGAIKLTVTGSSTINGAISALGQTSTADGWGSGGAGAGGAVWLITNTVTGGGVVRADGGTAAGDVGCAGATECGGGGGGGYVLISCNAAGGNTFTAAGGGTGTATANAGVGAGVIGVGTVTVNCP